MKQIVFQHHPGNVSSIVRGILNRLVIISFLFGSLASISFAQAENEVLSIKSPWIREAPPGIPTLAAYMEITNITESPISIIGVSSSIAKMTELHEVKLENEVMKMRKMADITLNSGQTLELKAGGSHVMLMGVQESFKQGAEIEIIFELKDLPAVKVMVPVKKDS